MRAQACFIALWMDEYHESWRESAVESGSGAGRLDNRLFLYEAVGVPSMIWNDS